ncbi:hypothetical protein MUP00_06350 [Candidatus Bathyarchaeota archaeon]|jgi:hypothetical protein|nr:hypothetical protein [Candidatus Bathyarchaeota archaeon]
MGEMVSIRVLTGLMKDHSLPEGTRIVWQEDNEEQTSHARETFKEYLREGWMAFSESRDGRRQIFAFDPGLARIILVPPLGGG